MAFLFFKVKSMTDCPMNELDALIVCLERLFDDIETESAYLDQLSETNEYSVITYNDITTILIELAHTKCYILDLLSGLYHIRSLKKIKNS